MDCLKKILTNYKQKKFSLINIYPSDVYFLENFINKFKKEIKDDIIVVGKKIDLVEKEYKLISPEIFNEKRLEFYEKTRNGILIWFDKFEKLEELNAYYPVVFIYNIEEENKFKSDYKDDLKDWKPIYYQKENLMVLVNLNIKNFDNYVFTNKVEFDKKIKEKDVKPVYQLEPENYINYDIFKNLPKPTIKPADKNNIKWCQEFYTYIVALLTIIVPVEKVKLIPYIINKQNFKSIWLKAFTHFINNLNITENYESLEHIGDKALKHSFINYYYQRFPYATAADMTNVTKLTQSDDPQSELSSHMGLINWADIDDSLKENVKINEDLLESFSGALDVALYRSGNSGASVPILVNMFSLVYENYTFDIKLDAKTWLEQLIEQILPAELKESDENKNSIYLKKPNNIEFSVFNKIINEANKVLKNENSDKTIVQETKKDDKGIIFIYTINNEGKYKCDIRLNDYGAKILNLVGNFKFKANQILGSSTVAAKILARRNASNNAKKYLGEKGIDENWLKTIKNKKSLKYFKGLEEQIILKAKQKHKDIIFIGVTKKELKHDKVFVLFGENKKGHKYILYRNKVGRELNNNFLEIGKKYLDL